jgi:hypothetical protein
MNDVLAALWAHTEQHWKNPAAHAAMLDQCTSPRDLGELAKRYRAATRDPNRALEAEQQLQRITQIAMAQLTVARELPATRPPYAKYALIALFLLGSAILAAAL